MKILFIGDPHIKLDNHEEIDILLIHLCQICKEIEFERIIIGGDLMHYHERIFTQALNKTLSFIKELSVFAPIDILVGNHDMINNQQFLTSNHWMNVLSDIKNVSIIEKPVIRWFGNFSILLCPYVYPGRFIEALETVDIDWRDRNIIFAHQEFKGCKMGSIVSIDGDDWKKQYPQIISGHIHDNQKIGDNIYYPGAPLQHAFGDTNKRVVCFIDEKQQITDIILNVPKKIIIKGSIDEVNKRVEKENTKENKKENKNIKLKISATIEEFKIFKETNEYKDYIKNGIKIQLDVKKNSDKDEKKEDENIKIIQSSFPTILKNLIILDSDPLLKKIFNEIKNSNI